MEVDDVTPETLRAVLMRLAETAERDKDFAGDVCHELNMLFDDLLNQDFFGTEGQLDPRGDHRD